MIQLNTDICSEFDMAASRECLETNGLGGYASSTVSGANTRRYHGLLVAATRPPMGRVVMLSKFEETLIINGERFELSANQYTGKVHPDGFRHLVGFRLDPFPVWTFKVNGRNEDAQCLYDVIDGDVCDDSVRPNQIFAVSLKYSMLNKSRARKIVNKVESELLTPLGLRSLSPKDPRYVPIYIGSPTDRDASYHQGTVWSWLIGPFVEAYRKTHSNNPKLAANVDLILDGFKSHISETMLGQVSEIFDAEPPHAARGCAAQAWSVAEILRITN